MQYIFKRKIILNLTPLPYVIVEHFYLFMS